MKDRSCCILLQLDNNLTDNIYTMYVHRPPVSILDTCPIRTRCGQRADMSGVHVVENAGHLVDAAGSKM